MRRPISETHHYIRRKLKKSPEISMRKQVCLAYLKWGKSKVDSDLRKFVEMAVDWRKKEGKVGYHRTKLERISRKLFPEIKKQKFKEKCVENSKKIGQKNLELGRGWCDPKKLEGGAERMARARRIAMENGTFVKAKTWIIYPPDGEPFKIWNLTAFCRENGLSRREMGNTANNPGKGRHHRGWRAEKWDPTWDKLQEDG
jgi:hypothetical protein